MPIAIALLERFILPFLEKVLEMDEKTKMFWGTIVLGLAVLTGLMFLIGMFGLGVNSLIQAYAGLTAVMGVKFAAGASAFAAGVAIALAALVLLEAEAYLITGHHMWEPEFWQDVWQGIVNAFTLNWELIKKGVDDFYDDVWFPLTQVLPEPIKDAMKKIEEIFFAVWNPIQEKIDAFLEWIGLAKTKKRTPPIPSLATAPEFIGPESPFEPELGMSTMYPTGTTTSVGDITMTQNNVFETLMDSEEIASQTSNIISETLDGLNRELGLGD